MRVFLLFFGLTLLCTLVAGSAVICCFPESSGLVKACRAAPQFLLAEHPALSVGGNLTFRAVVLALNKTEGPSIVRAAMVSSLGQSCDFIIGTGYSRSAIVQGVLTRVPLIEPTASSTELADRASYPLFSRLVPADGEVARVLADFMRAMGWRRVAIVSSTESHGAAVRTALRLLLQDFVVTEVRVPDSATTADADRVVEALAGMDQFRVVVLAIVVSNATQSYLEQAIVQRSLHTSKVLLGTDAMCDNDRLKGLICTHLRYTEDVLNRFITGHLSAPSAVPDYQSPSVTLFEDHTRYVQRKLSYLATFVDAIHVAMATAAALCRENPPLDGNCTRAFVDGSFRFSPAAAAAARDTAAMRRVLSAMRALNASGASGALRFDGAGERLGSAVVLQQHRLDGQVTVLADQPLQGMSAFIAANTRAIADNVEWEGRIGGPIPPDASRSPADSSNAVALPVALSVCGTVIIGAVALLAFFVMRTAPTGLAGAPQGIVFAVATQVFRGDSIWRRDPGFAVKAIHLHNSIGRRLADAHGGFMVPSSKVENLRVLFGEPLSALRFAVDFQAELQKADWGPNQLDRIYTQTHRPHLFDDSTSPAVGLELDDSIANNDSFVDTGSDMLSDDDPSDTASAIGNEWAGLRVCCVVHKGMVRTAKRFGDAGFAGPLLTEVGRLIRESDGGQVVASVSVLQACGWSNLFSPLGSLEAKPLRTSRKLALYSITDTHSIVHLRMFENVCTAEDEMVAKRATIVANPLSGVGDDAHFSEDF